MRAEHICACCGAEIFAGEDILQWNNDIYCEECCSMSAKDFLEEVCGAEYRVCGTDDFIDY